MSDNTEVQKNLIASLKQPGAFPDSEEAARVIETHISTVFLIGDKAYKLKKPVDFGFLDFSDLEKRHHFCEEELRLNRRLAPQLYLDVVAITGTAESPSFDEEGPALEYAVRMRQFDQEDLFDHLLANDRLEAGLISSVGQIAASFHEQAEQSGKDSPYGTAEAVYDPMQQNFDQLRGLIDVPEKLQQLDTLEDWTKQQYEQLKPLLGERKQQGYIRECHGDMHLGNIALIDNEVAIFDGIEFNDFFRWTDVMSEIAFLTMDLDHRGAGELSNIALNTYLEVSGDYKGLPLLRFYQVYRAMVRAKVSSFRLAQEGLSDEERDSILSDYQGYIDLALHYARPTDGGIILMHGYSGSGKTVISGKLASAIEGVRIRSDVERKRLNDLDALSSAGADIGAGIYSSDMTRKTYEHLRTLAEIVSKAGFMVIVDATFLAAEQRALFADLTPQVILDIQADKEDLLRNITRRGQAANDASDADAKVMEHQIENADPLRDDEPYVVMSWDGEIPVEEIMRKLA